MEVINFLFSQIYFAPNVKQQIVVISYQVIVNFPRITCIGMLSLWEENLRTGFLTTVHQYEIGYIEVRPTTYT